MPWRICCCASGRGIRCRSYADRHVHVSSRWTSTCPYIHCALSSLHSHQHRSALGKSKRKTEYNLFKNIITSIGMRLTKTTQKGQMAYAIYQSSDIFFSKLNFSGKQSCSKANIVLVSVCIDMATYCILKNKLEFMKSKSKRGTRMPNGLPPLPLFLGSQLFQRAVHLPS